MASLTDKTLSGFIWAFGERFGVQVIQLVIFIVLARVLTPEVFGLIGMLAVFIAVSQSLTDSGFGQALIQKKNADEIDFSSVFFMNLFISIVIYGVLFLTAPLIASFYGEPILIELVRVLGLRFIISAFAMVQVSKLTKDIQFKSLMIAKLPSTLIGGALGIGASYMGFGVWSLIIQQLADTTAYSLQVWIQSSWKPKFIFSWNRVKSLFDFGSKIMAAGILNIVSNNIYEILIGRFFSTSQVGYFTQANKIRMLPVQNISDALSRVTFPILSKIQDDDFRLKRAYKKIIRLVAFIILPVMLGAIVIAEPLFRFVLTEKWLPAVPYFQWLCISGVFYPINSYNLNILKVKGRSDLFLWLGVIKKVIEAVCLFLLIQYSVILLVIFKAFNSCLAYFINSYYSGRFIDYGIAEQLMDLKKIIFSALVMMGSVWYILSMINIGDLLTIIIGVTLGLSIYIILIAFFDRELLIVTRNEIRNYIQK